MEILAFQPPPLSPRIPPWVEQLPTPKIPAGATALWFIGWFLKTAVDISRPPRRPRKLKFGEEGKENHHVVKVSDCREAIEQVLTSQEFFKTLIPQLITLIAKALPLVDAWNDLEDLVESEATKQEDKFWQPIIDDLVYEIAGYALSQLSQRHATKTDYNVRNDLRKSKRDRSQQITLEPPIPPGREPPPRGV
jgi:hypothetical protein